MGKRPISLLFPNGTEEAKLWVDPRASEGMT
jgi:hypothetical protein